jgi:hypothetical protein
VVDYAVIGHAALSSLALGHRCQDPNFLMALSHSVEKWTKMCSLGLVVGATGWMAHFEGQHCLVDANSGDAVGKAFVGDVDGVAELSKLD